MCRKLTNRQIQANESKERIRIKALELFKNTDYEDVSISDICRSAGMSTGNFYNYFTCKEELILHTYVLFDNFVETQLANRKYKTNLDAIKDAVYHLTLSADSSGSKLCGQMLRIQLKEGNGKAGIKPRYFDIYIHSRVKMAIEENEIETNYTIDEISSLILKITRGALYDWVICCGSYKIVEQGLHDVNMILNQIISKRT